MTNRLHTIARAAAAAVLVAFAVTLSATLVAPFIARVDTTAIRAMSFNPHAQLDTSHVQDMRVSSPAGHLHLVAEVQMTDAEAEGLDVLTVRYEQTPDALWSALLEAGFRGVPEDGCECLYIPVGTTVKVSGARYTATLDGWSVQHARKAKPAKRAPHTAAQRPTKPAAVDVSRLTPAQQAARLTPAQKARYGAWSGGPCGSDAQCAAYSREVLHQAPSGYGANVPVVPCPV